jgi:hypothetical protein
VLVGQREVGHHDLFRGIVPHYYTGLGCEGKAAFTGAAKAHHLN